MITAIAAMPTALGIGYTHYDKLRGHIITATAAREAAKLFFSGAAVVLPYDPSGPYQLCFYNVDERIKADGGKEVTGWMIVQNDSVKTGYNRYAAFSLIAHAVWQRPDGTLIEVTERYEGLGFIQHNRVKSPCQVSIYFLDYSGSGNGAEAWCYPYCYVRNVRL